MSTLDTTLPAAPMPDAVTDTGQMVKALALALADLTDAFLSRHGCFPLDRTNDEQRHWHRAMSKAYELVGQPKTEARRACLATLEADAGRGEVEALVVAARAVAYDEYGGDGELLDALGKAVLPFAKSVPWDGEPTPVVEDGKAREEVKWCEPPEGYETWQDYLDNPPPPTPALREVFRKYRENQARTAPEGQNAEAGLRAAEDERDRLYELAHRQSDHLSIGRMVWVACWLLTQGATTPAERQRLRATETGEA